MTIFVSCSCGKRISADDGYAGKRVRCPTCQGSIQIPEAIPPMDTPILEEEQALDAEQEKSKPLTFLDGGSVAGDAATPTRIVVGELGEIKLRARAGAVAYAPNNNWGVAGIDAEIQVLDLKSHKRAFKFAAHEDSVTALCFSPEGQRVLSGDASGGLLLWDLNQRKPLRWLRGHHGRVSSVAFAPSGQYAVSGGEEGCTRLWRLSNGEEYELFDAAWGRPVRCVSFSPDGRLIAAGGGGGLVSLWSVHTGERIKKLSASDTVASLSFSKEGDFLSACGWGKIINKCKVWKWQIPTGKTLPCWESPSKLEGPIEMAAMVPGGNYVAAIGQIPKDQSAYHKAEMAHLQPSDGGLGDLVKVGLSLYAIADDLSTPQEYCFQLWNVNTGHRTQNFPYQGAEPLCLAASPNGLRALLGTKSKVHIFGLGAT